MSTFLIGFFGVLNWWVVLICDYLVVMCGFSCADMVGVDTSLLCGVMCCLKVSKPLDFV